MQLVAHAMDFWKYFTNKNSTTSSEPDKDELAGEGADTAVMSSLTKTTSRIMISHDEDEGDSHQRYHHHSSSRKRTIGSMESKENPFSPSPYTSIQQQPTITTTTTTTSSRIPIPTLQSGPSISSHPTSIPKPIPKPKIPQYLLFFLISNTFSFVLSFFLPS